jgi:hypothetical protein
MRRNSDAISVCANCDEMSLITPSSVPVQGKSKTFCKARLTLHRNMLAASLLARCWPTESILGASTDKHAKQAREVLASLALQNLQALACRQV